MDKITKDIIWVIICIVILAGIFTNMSVDRRKISELKAQVLSMNKERASIKASEIGCKMHVSAMQTIFDELRIEKFPIGERRREGYEFISPYSIPIAVHQAAQ
jgi:hypothetical protein